MNIKQLRSWTRVPAFALLLVPLIFWLAVCRADASQKNRLDWAPKTLSLPSLKKVSRFSLVHLREPLKGTGLEKAQIVWAARNDMFPSIASRQAVALFYTSSPSGKAAVYLLQAKGLPKVSKVYDIDLRFCSTFEETTLVFAEALSLPAGFGANADALHDVLNDLPSGRYVFKVQGTKRLDEKVVLKLRMVLASRPEGGVGYGDGAAVFLIE